MELDRAVKHRPFEESCCRYEEAMSSITDIRGREIIDSRGNPTVEADVILDSGALGRAAVPSGASTGTREAVELRDGDAKRYGGKGVLKAVEHINTVLRRRCWAAMPRDQAGTRSGDDRARRHREQGPPGRQRAARPSRSPMRTRPRSDRAAAAVQVPVGMGKREPVMPVPMMNIINGGAHANNSLDIQEFMILPVGAPSFREALRYGAEIFHALKKILRRARPVAPRWAMRAASRRTCESNEAALEVILQAIEKAGYKAGKDIYLGLDAASSEFFKDGQLRAGVREPQLHGRGVHALPRGPGGTLSRSSPSRMA